MISTLLLTAILAQAPAPSASSTPDSCNHEAIVTKAEYPRPTRPPEMLPLTTIVTVAVAADGSVERATITQSSGDMAFDMAALHAAKSSLYEPKLVNCRAVEGTYKFKSVGLPMNATNPPN